MYHEDVDLCWRLWLQGYKCVLTPESVVYHKGGASSGKLEKAYVQRVALSNALSTLFKNLEAENLRRLLPLVLYHLIDRARSYPPAGDALSASFKDFVGAASRLLRRRRHVQAVRVRTDAELFSEAGHPVGFLFHASQTGSVRSRLESLSRTIDFDSIQPEELSQELTWMISEVHMVFSNGLAIGLQGTAEKTKELAAIISTQQKEIEARDIEIEGRQAEIKP